MKYQLLPYNTTHCIGFENDERYIIIDALHSDAFGVHFSLKDAEYELNILNNRNKIKCLLDFLNVTGFNRSANYPDVNLLKTRMSELRVKKDLRIDIMSFFLYDNESK